MKPKKKFLLHDNEHTYATHNRWVNGVVQSNRDLDDPSYKDEWKHEPCFLCIFYVELKGNLGFDWGVCTNSQSSFDGRVMFEHDDCDHYSQVDDDEYENG